MLQDSASPQGLPQGANKALFEQSKAISRVKFTSSDSAAVSY